MQICGQKSPPLRVTSRAKHIYSNQFISQKINYIHENPVVAGIVLKPEDYPYSSAMNYAGVQGLLPVTVHDLNYNSGGLKIGGWPMGGSNSGKWQCM